MPELLSTEEYKRYSRHLLLPEFGLEGQLRLKESKVLVVGCGGLGSPTLLYLAAAGIGTIGLIDNDIVDDSNLQRQVLYGTESVGKPKVEEATKRLQSLNPYINLVPYQTTLSSENALEILSEYDLVIDGTDNFPTRYLINDACVLLKKPFIYGAIYKFEGQVAIFNVENGVNYRDLFPVPPPPELAPNCAEAGVLGVLPGIVGSLQANEAIKFIAKIGEPLIGKLFVIDALSLLTRIIKIPKQLNRTEITGLIDYEVFCNSAPAEQPAPPAPEGGATSPDVFGKAPFGGLGAGSLGASPSDFQLIDVREEYEYNIKNMGGELMPLSQIENFVDKISRTKTVIVYCQSGGRSQKTIDLLTKKYGFTNLKNLDGGMNAFFSS